MKKFIYITILLLTTSVIFAQDEELEVKGKVLYKDQVNSLKPPVPILDVPQSVSVITDEDILNQGFREIGDLVRYTPGVNTSQGEGHRDAVVFRGVRSTADFFQDGVRDDVQYYRSLYNVEQVEILRGPNALLFGRGGTGGLINRVSKRAVIDESFTSFIVGADTFAASDFSFDANFATSDNVAWRINAHIDSLDNHRDFYDGQRIGINPTVKIQASDETVIDISYEFADHERFIDRGIPTANGSPVEGLKDTVFGTEATNTQEFEASILNLSLSHEYSDSGKFNFAVTANDFEKMYMNLYASGWNNETKVVTLDGYKDPTERESLIVSGSIVQDFDRGTLLFGVEYIDTENKNHRYNTNWSTTGTDKERFKVGAPSFPVLDITQNVDGRNTFVDFTTSLNNRTKSEVEVASVYIQGDIDLSDQWKMILGGRLDSHDITITDTKTTTSVQTAKDETFSPRLGIIFKPVDEMSVYFSYSESFLPRAGEQYKKLPANADRLDPDVYENTEIGLKYDMDSGLSLAASIFESDQTTATYDSVSGETGEVVGLKTEGIEFSLTGTLEDDSTLSFGLGLLDGTTSTGGEPRELPDLTYSVWYMKQIDDMVNLGIGATHQGDTNIGNNSPGNILPAYTRIDLALTLTPTEDDTVRINFENLTDELYFPHAHSTHQASVGETVNARITYSKRL